MSVCVKCGEELKEGMKFCIKCGNPAQAPAAEEKKEETAVKPEEAEEVVLPEAAITEPAIVEPVIAEPAITEPAITEEAPEEKPVPTVAAVVPPPPPPPRPPVIEAPKPTPAPEVNTKAKEDPEKPGKKSKWGVISTWGYVGIDLLMAIPVIGFILTVIWACGGCRKYAKRNYARSKLIFVAAGLVLTVVAALVLIFVFPELIVAVYEAANPGYTIILP